MKVQQTAYLDIRFDWLFSIYVVFAVARSLRYLWLGWRPLCGERQAAPTRPRPTSGPMNFASPFSISIVAITVLAFSACRSATR